jgi:CRP-like cAMP-binding protein
VKFLRETVARVPRFLHMLDQPHRPRNRLFDALPSGQLTKLRPALESVSCARDQVLIEADAALDDVYFPESSVVSLNTLFADGTTVDMASIGREGCTGVPAVLGAKISSVRLLTQIPGTAMKMSRRAFTWALETMPAFKSLMHDYAQAFLHQAMVSGACNGAHRLSQRLARWLLTTHDRSDGDSLPVTQSLLADVLGVQRQSVSQALAEMERAELIESARRQITIVDREGLVEESCECYQRLRDRLSFHLPNTYARG